MDVYLLLGSIGGSRSSLAIFGSASSVCLFLFALHFVLVCCFLYCSVLSWVFRIMCVRASSWARGQALLAVFLVFIICLFY